MKLSDVPPPPRLRGSECAMAPLWEALPDESKATLAGWLTNPEASDAWVAAQLTDQTGHTINQQVVLRHRHGRCVRCNLFGRTWL